MNWTYVARKDFTDAVRSKLALSLLAFFSVLAFLSVAAARLILGPDATVQESLGLIAGPVQLVVPFAALVVAYLAIAGERESGSLKLLLSFPLTRRDVVVGKFVGRSGVVVLGVVAGFLVSGALVVALYGSLPVVPFVVFVGVTALYAAAYVGVAVGLSGLVASRGRAIAAALGFVVVMEFFWDLVPTVLYYALNGSIPGQQLPAWYFLLARLSPSGAYTYAVELVARVGAVGLVTTSDSNAETASALAPLADRLAGDIPFYLEGWSAIAILVLWATVPVAIGYLRFRHADL